MRISKIATRPEDTNGAFAESYAYDALGRRVSTTTAEGTIRHVYDGAQSIADLDADGDVVVSYTWGAGIDNLLAVHVNGATYYALTDVQGTVWGYVDASNNIVASFTYDAWGNILSATSSVPALARNRYRFQCREWSAATGLVNFRARWHDPATGRWLSKDPIGLGGGLNLYAFCGNDPVNSLDPYGEVGALIPIVAPVIVAGAIVGGAYVGANIISGAINGMADALSKPMGRGPSRRPGERN